MKYRSGLHSSANRISDSFINSPAPPAPIAQTAQGIIETVKGAGRTVKTGGVMRIMGRLAEPERRMVAKPVLASVDAMPSDLLYVHISRKALAGGFDRPIARRTSVRETIVGTPVVSRTDVRLAIGRSKPPANAFREMCT